MKLKGNLEEQTAQLESSDGLCILTIKNGEKEVRIKEILERIYKIAEVMPDKTSLIALYSTIYSDQTIDTEDKTTRSKISGFMVGYLLGKFMSNTKSIVKAEYFREEV